MKNKTREEKRRIEAINKLVKDNPSIPSAVYDIEESQEMADAYADMFGY